MSGLKTSNATSLASIAPLKARVANAAGTTRDALAAMIRTYSVATQTNQSGRLEEQIDAALRCVQALPSMIETLEQEALDPTRPVYQRLGVLAALHYAAASQDLLNDELPGAYGLLDDWLLIQAATLQYTADPAVRLALQMPSVQQVLADTCTLIWMSLPPATIQPLAQLIWTGEQEAAWLSQAPDAQLRPMLEQLLRQPAPARFSVPMPPSQATPPPGGWSTNANGAIWGSGDGRSLYMRFEGGGSVGMVNGKIVGGP